MLADRIKQRRKQVGLTQEELAEKLNTTKATISNYETDYSTPSNEMLRELAKHLNTSTDYLLGISEETAMYIKEEAAFYDAITDPELKRWYRELPNSKEEDLRKLRRMWDIIKSEDK